MDAWGLLSMAIWVVALLLAVSQGATPRVGCDVYSQFVRHCRSLFVVFLLLELLQKHPFVDLRLYCNRQFTVASMAALLFDAVFNSAQFSRGAHAAASLPLYALSRRSDAGARRRGHGGSGAWAGRLVDLMTLVD